MVWDVSLTIANLFLPDRAEGHVVPEGHLGFGGKWPEYIAPKEGDSRCACPALNALANHGILPRDGRNIPFKDVTPNIQATYNFAASFCYFASNTAAKILKRDYNKDTFDLAEISLHNGIEHDASLTREDTALAPNQASPHLPFVDELLASATGKDEDGNPLFTAADLSRYSSKRRADSREKNPEFTLDASHKAFGSSNTSGLLEIFGGRVNDLRVILTEERLPDGWEPRVKMSKGLTILTFNKTVLKVEMGIDEKKYLAEKKAAGSNTTA